jgi:cytidine deaminase
MTSKEIKIAYIEYESLDQLDPQDRELAEAAIDATKGSYAPYSGFNVGAAVRLDTGEIVKGANQENAAYPSGICAERTAMFYASATYPDSIIKSIAVTASQNGILCDNPATPCGACRQVMAQYQTKGGSPMSILLIGGGKIWKFDKVDDLLPLIFDSI